MGISLFCIIALIAPAFFLSSIGLLALRDNNAHILWLVLAASICLLAAQAIFGVFSTIKSKHQNHRMFKGIKYRLRNLTPDEGVILQKYILQNSRTQKLDMNAGPVIALEQDNIIYRANIMTTDYCDVVYFNFNIQVLVMQYLEKHPELIGLKRGKKQS